MNKKRIVHIVPAFGQGGVQTGILYSLEDLNKVYDYKILVITKIDNEWIKDLSPLLKSYIIETGASGFIEGWIKGYRILKKMKPDFIISSMWKSAGLSASFKLFNKKIGLASFFHTSYSPHFPYRFFMKLLFYLQDMALADSAVTRDFIAQKFKIKNAHVIPYLFPFKKITKQKDFNPSKIRMAYFGIISPVKNIDRALAFCKLCKTEGINFIFDIYAHGAVDDYNNKIGNLGLKDEVIIKAILPLHLVIENMQHYDFLLQLSNQEGMALSVVEALNCGLVPLVTPVGEIARYSEDGVNAIWLDPPFDKNLPQLVDKLKSVVADPEKYDQLSLSASITFIHYKKYSEALVEVLNQYLAEK